MAYFDDLSVNTYSCVPESGRLSVGWLAKNTPFQTGPTSEAFCAALDDLCSNHPIRLTWGYHVCEFCTGISADDSHSRSKGNGEIEVRSADGTWFVAPQLIAHYVAEHDYCPPEEYIEAVLNPSEIGKDAGPIELAEDEEIKQIQEREQQSRMNAGPSIDVKAIVRQGTKEALRRKAWWKFW